MMQMFSGASSGAWFEKAQRFGKSFMLPIAVLPAAGLLLGIGGALSNPNTLTAYPFLDVDWLQAIFTIMTSAGSIVFANLSVLFAVGVAVGLAKTDKGTAGLAALLAFLVMNANINGMFLVARAAFGLMRRQAPQGGRIINNGSISAHAPRPGSAPYTMSKHAVTGLTRTLALDGRRFDIACGQIDIGNALTEMAAAFPGGVPQADGSIRAEPVMDVAHVADAVLHMAGLPLSVNIPFLTIMARDMPFVGRG